MAESDQLFSYLHKINKSLTINSKTSQHYRKEEKRFDKKCIQNFYKKVSDNLDIMKEKIGNIIQKVITQRVAIKLQGNEKEILKELQTILGLLNKEISYLLQEGILNVYVQLLNLREKASKNQIHFIIQNLAQDIIQTMSKLLFNYFCYQQYKIRTQKTNRKRHTSILSYKAITQDFQNTEDNHGQSQFDFQLMETIQESMKEKSIYEIINQNMKKEIAKMTKEESICRICSQKAKLRNIEKHVKLCQKKHDFKQEFQIKKRKMNVLLNQMRLRLSLINQKSIKSKQDQSLKAIITSLLYKQNSRKQKGVVRRSETFISSSANQLTTFVNLVQQHIEIYGKHQTLNEICIIQKELTIIEKNISGLQNVIQSLQINNQDFQGVKTSLRRNSKRSSKNSLEILSTLNSLEELNCKTFQKNVQFDLSDQTSQSQQDEKQNKFTHKSMKQQIIEQNQIFKKFQSKQSFKDKQNKQMYPMRGKNYVSLQKIPFGEQVDKKISFSDFQVLKFIGKGAYGKVYMVRRKQTKDVYALKIITLSDKITQKQLELIAKQHQVYKKIQGDYLVKAPFLFNQKSSHMFVLEYMPGGDLRKLLTQQVYFQQNVAQFYLAEIVLAIQHLHKHNIIHRDLKPQNLVLDEQGHLKLTDFGLSKFKFQNMLKQTKKLNENASNIHRSTKRRTGFRHGMNNPNLIGTPDYIAPQIINNVSTNNLTIDWWSLGVLAYELIIGTRPFCADSIEEVIQNIQTFNIQWPEVGDEEGMITQKAKNLIESLLDKDFLNRLGANGADEIKAHPFFEGIDWENIKASRPPFQPNIQKDNEQLTATEDKILRQSIEQMINFEHKSNPKLKLQKFVRFDLLRSQTIQNVEKIVNQKANHIIKLKTLQKLQKLNTFQKQDQKSDFYFNFLFFNFDIKQSKKQVCKHNKHIS